MPETPATPAPTPRLNVIVAVAENGVIGADGGMPWHLPDEMRYFKRTTVGHVVIMGRRTFESFGGKALPDRRLVVVTRQPDYRLSHAERDAKGRTGTGTGTVEVAHSLDEARGRVRDRAEVFVAGGCELYRETLALADRLFFTTVHARPEGDTHFPEVDFDEWTLTAEQPHDADARHDYAFTMKVYTRRHRPAGGRG